MDVIIQPFGNQEALELGVEKAVWFSHLNNKERKVALFVMNPQAFLDTRKEHCNNDTFKSCYLNLHINKAILNKIWRNDKGSWNVR